jgi:hypothetical protein
VDGRRIINFLGEHMAKQKYPTVTLRLDQEPIVKEMARAKWGDKHGNKTRFVREAVDEKIEREKNRVEKNSQNESN